MWSVQRILARLGRVVVPERDSCLRPRIDPTALPQVQQSQPSNVDGAFDLGLNLLDTTEKLIVQIQTLRHRSVCQGKQLSCSGLPIYSDLDDSAD